MVFTHPVCNYDCVRKSGRVLGADSYRLVFFRRGSGVCYQAEGENALFSLMPVAKVLMELEILLYQKGYM